MEREVRDNDAEVAIFYLFDLCNLGQVKYKKIYIVIFLVN